MSGIEGMLVSDLFNESSSLYDAVIEIGKVGKWIEAIGIVILLWIIFQVINLMVNRKKVRDLRKIRIDLDRIESKIDKLNLNNKRKKRFSRG